MEEKEKEEEELMGILKLKRGILVGKSRVTRGGVCTPPPTWKTFDPHFHSQQQQEEEGQGEKCDAQDTNFISINCNNVGSSSSSVTARQLGSNLWQILPHLNSISKMNRQQQQQQQHYYNNSKQKFQGLDIRQKPVEDVDDTPSDDQPVSTGSFHRQIAASLIRHHRAVDRNGRALQPSPASYSSSMEITPYDHAASPSSSLEYKGRMGDPTHSLKTSTELLKVLNRIWCLEEQHSSNIAVTKGLKTQLDNARARIKELLREKQMDRQVMDGLMKQVAEHKLVRKNMEQDRLQSTLQSVRQELEDERKLRKRSESMHRKMAREISEMKTSFSKALNELERERHARILLEDLCDEFSMGIRDYEQELRSLKYRNDKEQVQKEQVDSLILHISEAWLDERVQMKLAEQIREDVGEMSMVVDKLRPEIEIFLKARQNVDAREIIEIPTKSKGSGFRRQSLESYPLNEATSAPKSADDEDDDVSTDSESNCFELSKNLGGDYSSGINHMKNVNNSKEKDVEETVRRDMAKRNVESHQVNNGRSVTGLQARFAKHMERMTLRDGMTQKEAGIPVETDASQEPTNQEVLAEEGLPERRSKRFGNRGSGNTNHLLDNLLRNNSSSIEGDRVRPVNDLPEDSHGHFLLAGPASPVKKWEPKILSEDPEISESSTRRPKGPRENSLKARLIEARLEGRNLQSKGF